MTDIQEGKIKISVPSGSVALKFDDPATHGLSHCMKAVDFIIEEDDRFWFLEIKDPDDPECENEQREEFLAGFLSGAIDEKLKYKYRDSFLYWWAAGKVTKPIYFVVLIAVDSLTEAELMVRTDRLRKKLPQSGPDGIWTQQITAGCNVFNLTTWNRLMTRYPASRASGTSD